MEMLLILAAVVVCAAAGTVVLGLVGRSRREPLRLDSEHDEADEALLLAEVGPSESPIDRSGTVLVLEPIRRDAREALRLASPDPARPEPAGPDHTEGDPR